MKIYIDSEYHCHTTNPDGVFREVVVPFFDGKCQTLIDGYMYVPIGEICTLSDGYVVRGELLAPWKPYSELDTAQREYERQRLAEYTEYLKILGVEV